jgi:hypothetical protein
MPQVALRIVVDGREDTISEYMCDWPNCPHAAVEVVNALRELRIRAALCAEHAARIANAEDGEASR